MATVFRMGDTDLDGYPDNEDPFPLDQHEFLDTDEDSIGNTADLDDDNDGLPDEEELSLGTNVLHPDTDQDSISDKEETAKGTSPTNPDSDGDERLDGNDDEPLIPQSQTREFFLWFGVGASFILFLLFSAVYAYKSEKQ